MGYTKLHGSIIHSTVWLESAETRLVWVTMLALADHDGMVMASVPGLADAAKVSLEGCRAALVSLSSPDPDSRSRELEGRRIVEVRGGWELVNHGHYRDLQSRDDRREKAAERQRRHRERAASRNDPSQSSRDMSRSSREVTKVTEVTTPDQIRSDQIRSRSATQITPVTPPVTPKATNLEQSLATPIRERAQALVDMPHSASWVQPHKWPECASLLTRFADALGWTRPRLLRHEHARVAVELLAAYSEQELDRAIEHAAADKWLQEPGKGPSCLTVEVVGRILSSIGKAPAVPKGPPRTGEDIALERRLERQRREIHEMMAAEAERKAQEATGA